MSTGSYCYRAGWWHAQADCRTSNMWKCGSLVALLTRVDVLRGHGGAEADRLRGRRVERSSNDLRRQRKQRL